MEYLIPEMRLLKLVFRLILVAFSTLFPMPTYPVLYHTVGTVQEYVLPKGPEGMGGPAIVYWEHTVRPEEAWAEDPTRGPYLAACEEADILPGNCLDLWMVERAGRWQRLADLGAEVRAGDGLLELSAPFPLARRRLVIFKELSGTLDPARFRARDFFEDWPPPL
jgi:hypothetical protein